MLFETAIILALSASALGRAHQKRYGTHSHHHHHTAASSGDLIMPSGGPYSVPDNDTDSVFQPSGTGFAIRTGVSAAHGSSAALVASVTTKTSSKSTNTATVASSSSSSSSRVSSVPAGELSGTSSASTAAANVLSPSPASSSMSSLSATPLQARTSAVSSASDAASALSSYNGIGHSVKRGIPYNLASLTGAFNSSVISWAYNWDSTPAGQLPSGVSYVPMLWSDAADHTTNWKTHAQSALDSGASALLSFNEPDVPSQANMSPSNAATAHIKYMNGFAGGKAEIVSPAIGNYDANSPPAGAVWLQEFFDACAGKCKVDVVAFHWYDQATNFGNFKLHTNSIISTAAANGVSKVWLTEFQAYGDDSAIIDFIAEALPFLEATPAVERYAWQMCESAPGSLLSGTSLSDIGKAYVK